MGLLSFQYHYSSYTKLPFPPHLFLLFRHPTTHKPSSRFRRRVHMGPTPATVRNKDKLLVIVGATGCGKSNLSVDLATWVGPPAEIINSDKMQVHRGLDVTTNKIPLPDRRGVPHHLLGSFDGPSDFTPSDFRLSGGAIVSAISSSGKLPILAGGSNSLVHALLLEDFDPASDFFGPARPSGPAPLRYDCCFLWVDVAGPVLDRYLCERVDEMLETGMFEELERFFAGRTSGSGAGLRPGVGIMKAIGVPEFEGYFRKYPPRERSQSGKEEWDLGRREAYEEAVREIKENTCRLARRQVEKILRLRDVGGWDLRRVDATASLEAKMEERSGGSGSGSGDSNERRWAGVWEKQVLGPCVEIVRRFLEDSKGKGLSFPSKLQTLP